jgi:hypothetical protein
MPQPHPNWVRDPPRDILSEQNLAAVRDALRTPGAVVFGWHYFYYGGSARSELLFVNAEELIKHVRQSRPGDHFTLYDLDSVAPLAVLHLGDASSRSAISLTEPVRSELARVGSESPGRAVVLVQRACEHDGRVTRCSMVVREPEDLVDTWEQTQEFDAHLTWPRDGGFMPLPAWFGELFAFDEPDLDRGEPNGRSIASVSNSYLRRIHALVDAKRPDDDGLIPTSGAY